MKACLLLHHARWLCVYQPPKITIQRGLAKMPEDMSNVDPISAISCHLNSRTCRRAPSSSDPRRRLHLRQDSSPYFSPTPLLVSDETWNACCRPQTETASSTASPPPPTFVPRGDPAPPSYLDPPLPSIQDPASGLRWMRLFLWPCFVTAGRISQEWVPFFDRRTAQEWKWNFLQCVVN